MIWGYIAIGEQFGSQDAYDQIQLFLELAERDRAGLEKFGWLPQDTEKLRSLGAELLSAIEAYEKRFGYHLGRTAASAEEIDRAKRWRLRAISIGENKLEDQDALGMPTCSRSGPT